MTLSRTQVNQLGDRLRVAPLTDADRRPEKTPDSIIAKLRRTKIELVRMQDVAGCRITVDEITQ
jgi:ppGpp synthetase/RelA/SpoT-type nucleotidyltranferase